MIEESWTPVGGAPLTVAFEFRAVSGHVECVAMTVRSQDARSPRISSTLVRGIPVGRLMQNARDDHAVELLDLVVPRQAKLKAARLGDLSAAGVGVLAPRKRPGRPRIPDEKLRQVATVYRGSPVTPVLAVKEHFHLEEYGTAARWVHLARLHGFLDPTTPGRRGGIAKSSDESTE